MVAGLGVRVGHLGGRLVYVHGAAAAYVTDSVTVAPAIPLPGPGPEGREERERR